jgi:hypothetical protein
LNAWRQLMKKKKSEKERKRRMANPPPQVKVNSLSESVD